MNSNQKAFLKELGALFDKYSINEMNADKLEPINFISNGMADNEKIEAADYFENFLTESTDDDRKQ